MANLITLTVVKVYDDKYGKFNTVFRGTTPSVVYQGLKVAGKQVTYYWTLEEKPAIGTVVTIDLDLFDMSIDTMPHPTEYDDNGDPKIIKMKRIELKKEVAEKLSA